VPLLQQHHLDGPDADSDSSTYLNDTPIVDQHFGLSPGFGFSLQRIDYDEGAEVTAGGNGIDGSEESSEDTDVTFATKVPTPNESAPLTLTLALTGMTPHLGQLFELRVVDQSDNSEVGRVRVDSVAAADFSVSVPGLAVGGSYNVDFYADFNVNGLYDAPGTGDHAWRMTAENVQGDIMLAFAHNTTFTDIMWPPYVFTLALTGMDPHLGQLFELRLVDQSDSSEVGRVSVDAVAAVDFSVSVPGLAVGGSYNIDFYADFNSSGTYDAPPADHAWRMTLLNAQGDMTLAFAHNTDFTDVMWDYLTLSLTGMSPHLGQLFELRVVAQSPGGTFEVSRVRVDSISSVDFSVSVPGLAIGGSYNIDFYADFNENGQYDAPPADHAWRLAYDYAGGYATLAFAHNTDFTDILWPGTVGLKDELAGLPLEFALHPNYPNPFNPATTLRFDLPAATELTIVVYDLIGREVIRLVNRRLEAGYHRVVWHGKDESGAAVATGLYIGRIATPKYTKSIKMVLLK